MPSTTQLLSQKVFTPPSSLSISSFMVLFIYFSLVGCSITFLHMGIAFIHPLSFEQLPHLSKLVLGTQYPCTSHSCLPPSVTNLVLPIPNSMCDFSRYDISLVCIYFIKLILICRCVNITTISMIEIPYARNFSKPPPNLKHACLVNIDEQPLPDSSFFQNLNKYIHFIYCNFQY
jgi:hypothetical protein